MQVGEFASRGGHERAKKLTKKARVDIAIKGAAATWAGHKRGLKDCACKGCAKKRS